MPNSADRVQAITATVGRYLDAVVAGNTDELADFYADDATLEDPVGTGVHIGRTAIHGFYAAALPASGMRRECELLTLRVCGHEAAFHFRLTITAGDSTIRIEPIETMVFDQDGKVAAMKAYWSESDVTRL